MKHANLPFACVLTALLVSAAPNAHAQPVASRATTPQAREADAHAARGASLVKKKKTQEALAAYEQAYAVGQDPKHLFIVAKLRADNGDTAAAARAYTEYLKNSTDAEHRGQAMGEMQRLLSGVGRVSVKCDLRGVSIAIDGAVMTTTPVAEPILVNPGLHTLTATKAGFVTVTRSVTAKAEDTVAIALEMTPGAGGSPEPVAAALPPALPAPAGPPPPLPVAAAPPAAPAAALPAAPAAPATTEQTRTSTTEAKPTGKSSRSWIGWTAAGALAVGAVATGIVAATEASTFDMKKETFGVTNAELEDAQATTRLWTVVTAGLGVAAIGVVTITLLTSKSSSSGRAAVLAPTVLRPSVAVGVNPTGMRLYGSF